jgi:putative transcriptional regulator
MSIDKRSPKNLAEIVASRPRADLARIDATTEEEIAGYEREDGVAGFDWKGAKATVRPPVPDVRALRQQFGMTREVFAKTFGLDLRAVEAWEQQRREPDRAARILLAVIADAPEVVKNAVAHLAA